MTSFTSTANFFGNAIAADEAAVLKRLDALARLLDSAFRIPGLGTRIGADALLNLLPGAGVVLAKGLSAYLIYEAHRLGVPRSVLLRMLGNVGLDFAISVVPIAGWIGDVFFRANLRNMTILREHLAERQGLSDGANPMTCKRDIVIDGEFVRTTT